MGQRNSAARRAVIELLGRQRCCVTAQEIFDGLRAEGRPVGIASIYRSLEQLTRDGFVQRVDVGAPTARYEPVQPDGEHHHHLVCADCGKVEAFADPELEQALHKVEDRPATPSRTTSSSAASATTAPPKAGSSYPGERHATSARPRPGGAGRDEARDGSCYRP